MCSSTAPPFMSTGHGVVLAGRLCFGVSTHGAFAFVILFSGSGHSTALTKSVGKKAITLTYPISFIL